MQKLHFPLKLFIESGCNPKIDIRHRISLELEFINPGGLRWYTAAGQLHYYIGVLLVHSTNFHFCRCPFGFG